MSAAVAYLRKSKVSSDRHLSWDVQEAEIWALAARHGDTEIELLSDWGRSGRGEKTAQRAGFRRLRELVAAGSVSVVYSYSLSRLARSLTEYAKLAELCRDKGVKLRLCKEGEFDYTTATGRLVVDVLARFAQFEAELAQERAKETISVRRRRGDYIGSAPYGSQLRNGRIVENASEAVEPILDAYRAEGSFHGAARALNQAGIKSRRGLQWSEATVRRVVRRVDPETGRNGIEGRQLSRRKFRLAGIMRCHCGNVMTGTTDTVRGYGPYLNYVCWRARNDPSHPKPHKIAESRLLPLVQAEAAHLAVSGRTVELEAEQGQHDDLLARRKRVLDNYEDGYIDRSERDAKVGLIEDEIERLDLGRRIETLPPIDWSLPPDDLNEGLRLVFERIELGTDLMPARFMWRVPEWRAA